MKLVCIHLKRKASAELPSCNIYYETICSLRTGENRKERYRNFLFSMQRGIKHRTSSRVAMVDNLSDGAFETAVAAAASAVISLEREGSVNQKRLDEELRRPLTKTKNKRTRSKEKQTGYIKISRLFSGKAANEDGRSIAADEKTTRKPATLDQLSPEDSIVDFKIPVKTMGTTTSFKKTPTISSKYLNDTDNKRTEQTPDPRTGENAPSSSLPTASSSGSGNWNENSINSSEVETKIDAWEKAKMAKIKKRYDKLMYEILEWENGKKIKAKQLMERKEREGHQRERVMQEYRDEISRIDKITGEARAVADERKRNDESKTFEKAKGLRSKGKIPKKCSCF